VIITASKPMRAMTATLTLAMALMSAAPSFAFCQTMCLPVETQVAHHGAPPAAHHHQSHAAQSHTPDMVLQDNAACKSVIQVALLRQNESRTIDRQVETAAPSDGQDRSFAISPASASDLHFPDRHGPPALSPPLVPLRV
jgi:hypothetical protein